ncbi:MAG: hypothetical protein AAF449_13765, partial [Myxococcota bacterium]
FSPGAQRLKCPYCDRENHIPQSIDDVRELDFESALANHDDLAKIERISLRCGGCGAQVVLSEGLTADRCSFCDNPLVAQTQSQQQIQPRAILPFLVPNDIAQASFERWMKSLWFAPNDLKRRAQSRTVDGVYIPFWTYDAETETYYSGKRGDYYYVNQTYTVKENGRRVTKTRSVRKTRWRSASGVVWVHFDDVLISGSQTLPEGLIDRLSPWDLQALVPFDERYMAGFRAECYRIDLRAGFERAKRVMARRIQRACERDIGGDEQRIDNISTQHYRVTFKHILLPLWISAYRYRERTYRFVINARTAEVQGERPYSWVKIGFAVVVGVCMVVLIVYLMR